ncbi:hypothetical protein A5695_26380 [Mycobacterium sp. E1747]|nr:hypothetical protein A5695_26380 [Mycobacterium sp. E1747]
MLIATTPESVSYVTGFRSISAKLFADYPLAAVVSASAVLLVIPAGEVANAIDGGFEPDGLVTFGSFFFAGDGPASGFSGRNNSFRQAVVAACKQAGGDDGVLGIESPARVAGCFDDRANAPVDATEWLLSVRTVKLPAEQELLRIACNIAEDGIRAGFATAAPGVRERDVARAVAAAMVARGGEPRFLVVTSGERSPFSGAIASERELQAGDLLRLDIGCQYEGYWSDIARTAVISGATDKQLSYYEAIREGLRVEIEHTRAGVRADELFATAVDTVRASGIAHYERNHVGHAIGMSVYERPVIGPTATTALEAGMVLCLETPYYELGWGGMMVEDTGLVTDTGFEVWTTLDHDLAILT